MQQLEARPVANKTFSSQQFARFAEMRQQRNPLGHEDLPVKKSERGEKRHKVQRKEALVSNAFNVDYEKDVSDDELYHDIVSYLGEFRFQLKTYDYSMRFGPSVDSPEWKVRDPNRSEAMVDKAKEAIWQREQRGESVYREKAEEKGLETTDTKLLFAKEGDTILWASPPGEAKEGYGDYGFIYRGKVKVLDDSTLDLQMKAIRVEIPKVDRANDRMIPLFNSAMSRLLGREILYESPEEFIAQPVVISGDVSLSFVNNTLGEFFPSEDDALQQTIFQTAIQRSQLLIRDVSYVLRTGTLEQRIQAFKKLEGRMLELRQELEEELMPKPQVERAENIIYLRPQAAFTHDEQVGLSDLEDEEYDVPPVSSSSCPIASSGTATPVTGMATANMFNAALSSLGGVFQEGSRKYKFDKADTCKRCDTPKMVGPCGICSTCNDWFDRQASYGRAA